MLLLQAVSGEAAWQLWTVVLSAGLIGVVGLSRAGSLLFWRKHNAPSHAPELDKTALLITLMLLVSSPLLVLFAQPVIACAIWSASVHRVCRSWVRWFIVV